MMLTYHILQEIFFQLLSLFVGVPGLRIFTLNEISSARDCFQYVLYKKYNIFIIYVIITTKYPPECTKLQHLIFFSGSMLALAFSLHGGLVVKESYPLLAFGQSKLVWDTCMFACSKIMILPLYYTSTICHFKSFYGVI